MDDRPRNPGEIMATAIPFDLNLAFRNWRERLHQSPHLRSENLDELESHLRDSVDLLQSKGLTADEAFMIGTRRIGTPDVLNDQFAVENGGTGWRHRLGRFLHRYKNAALHLLVLGYFTLGCWLLWGCLKVGQMLEPAAARVDRVKGIVHSAPAFSRLLWGFMPYWYVPPLLAMLYCGYVWTCKRQGKASASTFFAVSTGFLFLCLLPILIAGVLPIIAFLNRLSPEAFAGN